MNDVKVNMVAQTAALKKSAETVGITSEPKGNEQQAAIVSNKGQPPLFLSNGSEALTDKRPNGVTEAEESKSSEAKDSGEQEVQAKQVKEAVATLNNYFQSVQRDLEFNLDENSEQVVVKVIDRNTKETIRQIPDETALKMARNLQTEEPVSLLDIKV